MREKALEIAEEHFRRVNPSLWDGNGTPPADFINHRITYSLNRCTELDVSFEYDTADGWRHCCKLRDTLTDNLLEIQYGPGIHSPQRLVDTILEISKDLGGIHLEYAQLKRIFRKLKSNSPNEDLTAHIIFAYCLDGTDQGVRLDWYMEEEGNPGGWKVADCYILEQMRDAEAIGDLTRIELEDDTICYGFGSSSTCIRVCETNKDRKIRLEPLAGNQRIDGKWVDLSIDRIYGYCTLLERQLNSEKGCQT